MTGIGAVVIGRDEGDRLGRCLDSLRGACEAVVYVDSGSSDGSVALARARGAEVVELDRDAPFTAARARNAGFARLRAVRPDLGLVQFVDGDCEVDPGWPARGAAALVARPDAAIACGRRRERHPEASVYNRLADLEWDTPIGEAEACGGDALMRAEALEQVGGYDPGLIAGEEPELCLRLRRRGWAVLRLDAEMTGHDLAMTRLSQWWRRQVRFGYAQRAVAARHRGGPFAAHSRRALIWTAGWATALAATAAAALALRSPAAGVAAAAIAVAPAAQAARAALRARRRLPGWRDAAAFGALAALGKWAEAQGQLLYWNDRLRGRRGALIEYKGPAVAAPSAAPGAGGMP